MFTIDTGMRPVGLRNRSFPASSTTRTNAEIQRDIDISVIGLANAQITVYNHVEKRSRGLLDRYLAYFGTTTARNWAPVFVGIAGGTIPVIPPDEAQFTNIAVPAYENLENKLLVLSQRITAAENEYRATGGLEALAERNRLQHDLEVLATGKLRSKTQSQVPSLEAQQDKMQRRVVELMDSGADMSLIQQADYYVSQLQFEREFRDKIEGSAEYVLKDIVKDETENLQTTSDIAQSSSVFSFTTQEEAFDFSASFVTLPPSARDDAFASVDVAFTESSRREAVIQEGLVTALSRSIVPQAAEKMFGDKIAARYSNRLVQKIQHLLTKYDYDGDDIVKKMDDFMVRRNPMFQVLLEGMSASSPDLNQRVRDYYHLSAYDINLSRVGLAFARKQMQFDLTKQFMRDLHTQVFKKWGGDAQKLRIKIHEFIAAKHLESLIDKAEGSLTSGIVDIESLLDPATRRELFDRIGSQLMNVLQSAAQRASDNIGRI